MTILAAEGQSKALRRMLDASNCELLLKEIAHGNMEAFEKLYRATDSAIYGYALSLTKDHHEAQDIMMDTYLKIRSAAHLYVPQGKPMAWILTIVKNLVRNRWRTLGREVSIDDCTDDLPPVSNDANEEYIALKDAMHILNDDERQILILHAVSGLKHREIAEVMQLPLATVLSKYSRSLKKLRKYLDAQNEEV